MIDTDFQALNVEAFIEKLDKLEVHKDKEVLSEIAAKFLNRVRLGFRNSKNPDGEPWPHLKHRKGQPLLDTGTLLRSIRFEIKNDQIHMGTGLHYAKYHQFGTQHIPKRPFMPSGDLPDSWADEAAKIIAKHVNNL